MSKIDVLKIDTNEPRQVTLVAIPYFLLPAFRQLVSRGLNTWDHAPPEIKEFGDMICEGKVLQDYKAQDSSRADLIPVGGFTIHPPVYKSSTNCRECGALLGKQHEPNCPNMAHIALNGHYPY